MYLDKAIFTDSYKSIPHDVKVKILKAYKNSSRAERFKSLELRVLCQQILDDIFEKYEGHWASIKLIHHVSNEATRMLHERAEWTKNIIGIESREVRSVLNLNLVELSHEAEIFVILSSDEAVYFIENIINFGIKLDELEIEDLLKLI